MPASPHDTPPDAILGGGRDVIQASGSPAARSDQLVLLRRIIDERLLEAHFQPIIDLSRGVLLGYEGLIRGPADTSLHMPVELFRAAVKHGLVLRLERLCRLTVVQAFARLGLPQRLFLNVRPQCLALPGLGTSATRALLEQLGIQPERIVIELTEHLPMFDFPSVRTALTSYRALGFQVAIDDLGEGFASFRMWSELRPQYVKADMHFVQGIDQDPLKLQFLKSIQQIAQTSGSLIIAEGIETAAELKVVRDLGISYGQGYFIARPSAQPPRQAPDCVLAVLRGKRSTLCAEVSGPGSPAGSTESVLSPVAPDILTESCGYVGPGTGQDPMREITRSQANAARYANPLTLLPGNVPINEEIDRLLQAGVRFVACHCDVDHFKAFNDAYGYRRGDDAIQLAARILANSCNGSREFLGHLGGDDFILLLRESEWVSRCEAAVQRFAAECTHLYSATDVKRDGLPAEDLQAAAAHPSLTFSIGAVLVEPQGYPSHHEVSQAAVEAKQRAKELGGNQLFVERRRTGAAGGD